MTMIAIAMHNSWKRRDAPACADSLLSHCQVILFTFLISILPNLCADQAPPFLDVVAKAGELKVVDIHRQDQVEIPVDVQTLPAGDGCEAQGAQGATAVALPEDTG